MIGDCGRSMVILTINNGSQSVGCACIIRSLIKFVLIANILGFSSGNGRRSSNAARF